MEEMEDIEEDDDEGNQDEQKKEENEETQKKEKSEIPQQSETLQTLDSIASDIEKSPQPELIITKSKILKPPRPIKKNNNNNNNNFIKKGIHSIRRATISLTPHSRRSSLSAPTSPNKQIFQATKKKDKNKSINKAKTQKNKSKSVPPEIQTININNGKEKLLQTYINNNNNKITKNNQSDNDMDGYHYTLSFTVVFPHTNDTCYISYFYPFSYSYFQQYLHTMTSSLLS